MYVTQERCRICLEKTESHFSLHKKVSIGEDNVLISKILKYCGNIEMLHNDRKPNNVCSTCIENAKMAYRFKLTCVQSETTLNMEILNKMISQCNPLEFMKEDDIELKDEEISNIKDEQLNLNNAEVGREDGEESDDLFIYLFNDYSNAEQEENSDCFESSDEQEESSKAIENNDDVEYAGKTLEHEHKCPHCDKSFKHHGHMLRHSLRHNVKEQEESNKATAEEVRSEEGEESDDSFNDYSNAEQDENSDCFESSEEQEESNNAIESNYDEVENAGKAKVHEHKCTDCDKSFKNSSLLLLHSHTHGAKKKCRYCNFKATWRLLGMHMRQMHHDRKTIQCPDCDKRFFHQSHLKHHMRKHNIENVGKTKKPEYKCLHCNENFNYRSVLLRHSRMHEFKDKKKCRYCDFKDVERQLGIHMNKMHSDHKTFQCHDCDKGFFYKKDLRQHMLYHKDVARSHVCKVCGKKYIRVSQLRKHEMVHSGEFPYPCPLCNKQFRASSTWKEHMNVHTKQLTAFKCDLCLKEFSSKKSLHMHLTLHTGEKSHFCDVCEMAFTHSSLLRRHKTSQHPDQRRTEDSACSWAVTKFAPPPPLHFF